MRVSSSHPVPRGWSELQVEAMTLVVPVDLGVLTTYRAYSLQSLRNKQRGISEPNAKIRGSCARLGYQLLCLKQGRTSLNYGERI